jgi:glyoxylase-like metal-dependent hydrolase (beta-lactamase superfamily II)
VFQVEADPFIPVFDELAPGIWAGVRPVNPRFPVMGTVTFVVTDEGVVVYDGGGVALMAERTIEKIRGITDKPVTHVIISHWHGDHHFGIYRYVEEFDNVQVIAHPFTNAVFHGTRINYIDNQPTLMSRLVPQIDEMLKKGVDEYGDPLGLGLRNEFEQVLQDESVIQKELERTKVTSPTLLIDEKLTILSGGRTIEILYLGDGNTAGDLVMWLPEEKLVATGDVVVYPVPYGFNVPPRKWANTLRAINDLGYDTLVPGHGDIQHDSAYVGLLIEEATEIARQRDELVSNGVDEEAAISRLDFSSFEQRHTGGDSYMAYYYRSYFKDPFAKAAFKALKDGPMVTPDR